jgi:chemotaxis receptor (MCP) glutamine deamidase CheD
MKEKKTKKNKRRSVSKEIEELEERLKETGSLREQAVMSALIVEDVKTEAGRRIIFNTTQEMVGAYGLGNELRRNWEKFVKF